MKLAIDKRKWGIFLLGAALWLLAAPNVEAAEEQSFYFFPGRPVAIEKNVTGDLLVVGADVEITARVDGNVSVLGGDIVIRDGSITGDAVVIAGKLATEGTGTIEGSKVELAGGLRENHTATLMLSILFWFLTIGFGSYFFPERIQENAFELADDFVKAFLMGIYATGILVILALLSFMLVQVVVGIFLSVVVLLMAVMVYLFSVLTVFYFIGELIWKRIFKFQLPGLAYLVTGLAVYEGLAWIGLIGFVGTVVLVLGSIGATLLSRFGSFKPWFGAPKYWGHS